LNLPLLLADCGLVGSLYFYRKKRSKFLPWRAAAGLVPGYIVHAALDAQGLHLTGGLVAAFISLLRRTFFGFFMGVPVF
jgi:hypothetical protein